MKTYKNSSFIKRDYEATNIVFCVAEKAPNGEWEEVDNSEIGKTKCTPLYVLGGVQYFGWL